MHRSRRLRVLVGVLLAALVGASASPALAREPGWSDRLLRGTSAGDPSTAKTVTVLGLYGAAAASAATGLVLTLRARATGDEADDVFARAPAGFCEKRASDECHEYLTLRRRESERYLLGEAFFGGAAFLLLSGALTAELWPNQAPAPKLGGSFSRGHALLSVTAEF